MKNTLLIICLLVFIAFNMKAQTGNLKGNVNHGVDFSPSYGVTISLENDSLGAYGDFSDSTGYYEVENIPIGKYTLKLAFIGYPEHIIQDFEIFKDSTLNLNINYPCPNGENISKKVCPHGHKDKIIRIVYGYPTLRMMRKEKRGKIHLGGCIVSECDPKWYCKIHKIEF